MIIVALFIGLLAGAGAMWYVGRPGSAASDARAALKPEERPGAKGHGEREDHAERDGHDEGGEAQLVRLTEAQMQEFGIAVGTAGPAKLRLHVTLPGQVALNADRRAHIVPRIAGVVQQVLKNLGDQVKAGEVMAVVESRELADFKSAYLTAKERLTLADTTFRREEDLWRKKIAAEQDYLEAKKVLAEARIELRAAEQKLYALGFSKTDLSQVPTQADTAFTRYAITAPFDGTVIEKHITLGEVLKDDTAAYVIADLQSLWVHLSVYPSDLPLVRTGQPVTIAAGHGIPDARGQISYVGPLIGESRTALARVVLPNSEGHWRPGLFVTGEILVENIEVPLLIPKTALQTIEERPSVFVETAEGFQPQPVTLGRSNGTSVEVTAGLTPGQRYVTSGAFTLKAQLSKGAFGGGHGH
ncbi:MAG: efflux RND transporter periplasmic adaptor subunit [Candidatus Entotheonellia bacterium]